VSTPLDFGIDFTRIGPVVGKRFPDIVLPDQHGQYVNLHQARNGRRAVVVFHRSAGW
jgi:peroxiredoxin